MEAKEKLLSSTSTFFLEGWVPAEQLSDVEHLLSQYSAAWEATDPEPDEYPQVPVKLKNNRLTRPLNMVTDMYVYPAYDGVDPNPLMAPFFIFFFGMMMADMAYGLLMLAGGIFMRRKLRPSGTMEHMAGLLRISHCPFDWASHAALRGNPECKGLREAHCFDWDGIQWSHRLFQ